MATSWSRLRVKLQQRRAQILIAAEQLQHPQPACGQRNAPRKGLRPQSPQRLGRAHRCPVRCWAQESSSGLWRSPRLERMILVALPAR